MAVDSAADSGTLRTGTTVHHVTPDGLRPGTVDEVPALLAGGTGVVWVDIACCDDEAETLLRDVFGFHPLAVADCMRRTPIPKVHAYADHAFVVLHAPEPGSGGHMHYLELDQFVGAGFLVTVHGPVNPEVDARTALEETAAVRERLAVGRAGATTGPELSAAIVGALVRRLLRRLEELTTQVWELERTVTAGHFGNAEEFLERMFRVRHGLMTVATMAMLDREVYGRIARLPGFGKTRDRDVAADVVDQLGRIAAMADGQKTYIEGVIAFYRTRTDTKMTIAAERLAVIAGVTLPVTALSSVMGMNVIVSDHTEWVPLAILLAVMLVMSAMMLAWARRRGWW